MSTLAPVSLNLSSTSDDGNWTANITFYEGTATDDTIAETSVSVFLTLLFTIGCIGMLCFRSKIRDVRVRAARRKVRMDSYQDFSHNVEKRRIVEASRDVLRFRIDKPPQCHRVIPNVMKDSNYSGGGGVKFEQVVQLQDWRMEAKIMLDKMRAGLPQAFQPTARLMSMRTAVMSVGQMIAPLDVERFLRIHEAVLFGVHMGDGTGGDVTVEDLKWMKSFFYSTIIREL